MPRPRKDNRTRLTRQIAIRLTDAEYAQFLKLSSRAGLRPSQLARLLVRKRQARIVVETPMRLDPAYIAQVRAIGHNLNLLVNNAFIFRRVSPRVEGLCDDIRKLIFQAVSEMIGE